MDQTKTIAIKDTFPVTLSVYPDLNVSGISVTAFPAWLAKHPQVVQSHPYLPDLARLEEAVAKARRSRLSSAIPEEARLINPTLELLQLNWKHLCTFFHGSASPPEAGEEIVIVYQTIDTETPVIAPADSNDLLALKIVAQNLSVDTITRETGLTAHNVNRILSNAADKSLIFKPTSRLKRPEDFPGGSYDELGVFRQSDYFTLQWHITQRCDLSCRHCYDRSDRQDVSLEQGLSVLDQLAEFCRINHVETQVSFTGGNPLLHPHFTDLYTAAVEHGFMTGVLGNPMPEKRIREMVDIQKPEFYQVSLEGLEPHNDTIRGKGSFARVLDFLEVLYRQDIYSMVMLTLTKANMDQVLPLAEVLKDKADLFTFNRLSLVGEGTALVSADIKTYRSFLKDYTVAARENPILGFKDSLFNILQLEENQPLRGGCTGFGCGAAFNFVSLLPDGEVHACRKFPSLIGNIYLNSLQHIYYSGEANAYRNGASECSNCDIRPVCGGCLAVSYGFGQDIFRDPDPYCFIRK